MASSADHVGGTPTPPSSRPAEDDPENAAIARMSAALRREKAAKRKMYSYLVKIADELKSLRAEGEELMAAAECAQRRAWYEGGMWRGPSVLRTAMVGLHDGGGAGRVGVGGVGGTGAQIAMVPRAPVGLSDLFLDIVTVTAFTRVGSAIQDRGTIDLPALAYFAIFWQIWSKEASYSTRFDTTDVSSHLETLLACFALLGGSLSANSTFVDGGCARVMGMAGSVAAMHAMLHARVYFYFRRGSGAGRRGDPASAADSDDIGSNDDGSIDYAVVRQYATFTAVMNALETCNWIAGMCLPRESPWRPWIFLIGIVLNLRLPRGFMPNDFHASCSKRGVLLILLLGFNLQTVVVVASTFFAYWEPSWDQYAFLFLACFLLFMIKLLYVDDTYSIAPQDHALLYNRAAGFFFHIGNFGLLLFTTVMGSGLNLLAHSYLAAAAALPSEAKNLVCGGFSATILSIAFVKAQHIRRVPVNPRHERMFMVAYSTQFAGVMAVVFITARMCFMRDTDTGFLALMMRNEIEMLAILVFFAVVLIIMSWLDEMVELTLYSDTGEASEYRVRPFGFWSWFEHDDTLQLQALALERDRAARMAQKSPLVGSHVMSFSGSIYGSFANMSLDDV